MAISTRQSKIKPSMYTLRVTGTYSSGRPWRINSADAITAAAY